MTSKQPGTPELGREEEQRLGKAQEGQNCTLGTGCVVCKGAAAWGTAR